MWAESFCRCGRKGQSTRRTMSTKSYVAFLKLTASSKLLCTTSCPLEETLMSWFPIISRQGVLEDWPKGGRKERSNGQRLTVITTVMLNVKLLRWWNTVRTRTYVCSKFTYVRYNFHLKQLWTVPFRPLTTANLVSHNLKCDKYFHWCTILITWAAK